MKEIDIFTSDSRKIVENLENKVFLDSFLDIFDAHFGSMNREKQMAGLRKLGLGEDEMEIHARIIYNNPNFYHSIFNKYHLNSLDFFVDKKKLKSANLTKQAVILMFDEAKKRGLDESVKLDNELLQTYEFKAFARAMMSAKVSEYEK